MRGDNCEHVQTGNHHDAALHRDDGDVVSFKRDISEAGFSVLPMYPEEARSARVAGTVRIWFVLNGDGEVAQAGVASGPAMLQEAAMRSVRSWRFRPESLRSGVRCETKFVYVLNVQAKEGEPKLTVSMSDYRRVEVDSELSVVVVE